MRLEKEPDTIVTHSNADMAVLRSGKAKKNDPPIPEDLAPISGAGKRIAREEPEKRAFLDPIKFFEEQEEVSVPEATEEPVQGEEKHKRSRRNRHRNKHRGENKENAPQPDAPKAEEAKAEPVQGGQQKKNHHRRYRHRYHKPKQNNAE